jgi:geranylgeranyl reductase family protein
VSRVPAAPAAPAAFDYDVIVAGGGPGGCALAARLVRLDASLAKRVLVLDRFGFPREKPCGGGLTGHAIEAMAAVGLTLTVEHSPAPRARVRFGGFEREVTLPRPVNVIRREEFDASLVAQVRALGVEVREREGVTDFTVEAGGVTVQTRQRTLRARVLVGADGAASLVRKRLRPRDPVPIRLFKGEIPRPGSWTRTDEMLYDFTPMRQGVRGYLWVFPVHDDRLNVGLMHYPAPGNDALSGAQLTELLAAGLREHGLDLESGRTRGWPAWGYEPSAPVASPHVLTIGDAAGIDALTGEGIAVAMEHALVAGDFVARALSDGDFGFAGYRRALRKAQVGRELNLDRILARMLYGGRRWRQWLSLVLFDPEVLELYAARVAGGIVLADQKLRLWRALGRHMVRFGERRRELERAAAG